MEVGAGWRVTGVIGGLVCSYGVFFWWVFCGWVIWRWVRVGQGGGLGLNEKKGGGQWGIRGRRQRARGGPRVGWCYGGVVGFWVALTGRLNLPCCRTCCLILSAELRRG